MFSMEYVCPSFGAVHWKLVNYMLSSATSFDATSFDAERLGQSSLAYEGACIPPGAGISRMKLNC